MTIDWNSLAPRASLAGGMIIGIAAACPLPLDKQRPNKKVDWNGRFRSNAPDE